MTAKEVRQLSGIEDKRQDYLDEVYSLITEKALTKQPRFFVTYEYPWYYNIKAELEKDGFVCVMSQDYPKNEFNTRIDIHWR